MSFSRYDEHRARTNHRTHFCIQELAALRTVPQETTRSYPPTAFPIKVQHRFIVWAMICHMGPSIMTTHQATRPYPPTTLPINVQHRLIVCILQCNMGQSLGPYTKQQDHTHLQHSLSKCSTGSLCVFSSVTWVIRFGPHTHRQKQFSSSSPVNNTLPSLFMIL